MIKTIILNNGMEVFVDAEDFDRVNSIQWSAFKSKNTWYAVKSTSENGKTITLRMSRFILNVHTEDYTVEVDHRNNNGLDNRKENLRICTRSQNLSNRRNYSGNPYKGIEKMAKGNWRARIANNGKYIHLGMYNTAEEAARVYDAAAKEAYGEFASLNFN
jgi:hypothetical protein